MKLLKENGMLSEAWFIDGVRYGLGRSINEGLIAFKDEFFKYNSYLGKKQNEEGNMRDILKMTNKMAKVFIFITIYRYLHLS